MYDIKPHSKRLNLNEKCLYGLLANHNNLLKRSIYGQVPILSKVISKEESINDRTSESFVSYTFGENLNEDEFYKCIEKFNSYIKRNI